FGLDRGFDWYDDEDITSAAGRDAASVTSRALAWLERVGQPFFLFLNYFDPHAPYTPPAEFARMFSANDVPHADDGSPSAAQRGDLYDAEIRYMDHHFG